MAKQDQSNHSPQRGERDGSLPFWAQRWPVPSFRWAKRGFQHPPISELTVLAWSGIMSQHKGGGALAKSAKTLEFLREREVNFMKAYILIQTDMGKPTAVVEALRKIDGVKEADTVTGPYDAIALLEAADLDAFGELVTTKIQAIDGIVRTITCLAV